MAKHARKSRTFDTMREFSAALDAKLTTVSGWIRHESWPFSKRAPWARDIVPKVLRWAAENLRKGRPEADPGADPDSIGELRKRKLRAEIRKFEAHAAQAETALAKDRRSLHAADECEEEAVRRSTLIRNATQNIPTQAVSLALSHGLPHHAAPAYQKQIEELVNGCLRYLAASANTESETSNDSSDEGAGAAPAMEA